MLYLSLMGIYSRDYVREPSGQTYGWGADTPACKWLIIVNIVVFVLQLVLTYPLPGEGQQSYLEDWLALDLAGVRHGQVWRFVTYAFLHSTDWPLHLILNMLGLWFFGPEMERLYGTREFARFYLAASVAAGAGFVLWQLVMRLSGVVIGASGAVLAVMTLFATHYPGVRIYVYGIFPIEIRWMLALYVVLDLLPVLQALRGNEPASGVAHTAHLIGVLFGWLYRRFEWRLTDWFSLAPLQRWPKRWRQAQAKKTLRVYDPEPEPDLDVEVDRILAKIHEHGSGSLTEREQSILTRASQQYKNRR